MVENEQYMPPGFMENVALQDAAKACSIQAVNSKKRARLEMRSQTPITEDRARNTSKQNEVFMLKEALKSEREALRKLHIDLEEERGASMTAANEAMAMIARLQEQKAAVLMEARRYRRVAEERESHNQEAISLLKDALLSKEDDLLALQDLLNAYRETFLRLESQQGDQGKFLEEDKDKEQILLLEGPNATPSLCTDSNYAEYHGHKHLIRNGASIWRTVDGNKEFECHDEFQVSKHNHGRHENPIKNFTDCSHDHEGVHDEGGYDEDHYTGKGLPGSSGGFVLQNTYCEWQMFQGHMQCEDHNSEMGNDKHSEEQYLDDVSESIFARVKRLEERFEYLRQNQALEYRRLNVAHQADAEVLDDLEPELITRPAWESGPKASCNTELGHFKKPDRLAEDSVNSDLGEPEEVLKCLSFERVRMDLRNEQCSSSPREIAELGSECRDSRMNLQRVDKTSFAEINDDGGEGVHDVYEVQYESKRPFVRPPEQDQPLDSNGQHKCETGNMDMLIHGTLQVADKDIMGRALPVPSNQAQPEVCTAVDDKLAVKISLLDVKDVHPNVADEDVRQLKVRLQALESERSFMKEAIESLRKENKDLKVLQEIAQQLRELKSDVRRTEAPEQQVQIPLFSFFKGILSLTGLQNLAATEGSRCFLRPSSNSHKQEQGGLLHILNKTQNSVCVTRERKVNFNTT